MEYLFLFLSVLSYTIYLPELWLNFLGVEFVKAILCIIKKVLGELVFKIRFVLSC